MARAACSLQCAAPCSTGMPARWRAHSGVAAWNCWCAIFWNAWLSQCFKKNGATPYNHNYNSSRWNNLFRIGARGGQPRFGERPSNAQWNTQWTLESGPYTNSQCTIVKPGHSAGQHRPKLTIQIWNGIIAFPIRNISMNLQRSPCLVDFTIVNHEL